MTSLPETHTVPVALTIAGSDSSGGAGIQADLKTFTRLRVYGMSVVTAITSQNSLGVHMVTEVSAAAVRSQLTAVLEDIPPISVKIGMLGGVAGVSAVIDHANQFRLRCLVLDPVIRSSTGAELLSEEGVGLLRSELLPLAFIVTPNLDEAEVLTGFPVRTVGEMETAARRIHDMGPRHVLVKGGHLDGDRLVDIFFDGESAIHLVGDRIDNPNSHGTGCVLSSAIAAYLAHGEGMELAVSRAHVFTRRAIMKGLALGRGSGPCDPVGLTD